MNANYRSQPILILTGLYIDYGVFDDYRCIGISWCKSFYIYYNIIIEYKHESCDLEP